MTSLPAATGSEMAALGPKLDAAKHSLAEYQGVQNAMNAPKRSPSRYLGYLDDQGRAAVSIGNPDLLLNADPGPAGFLGIPGASIDAHSSYWDQGNRALLNFGAVIADVDPPYVVAPPYVEKPW